MRLHELPDGSKIDLDSVAKIGALFVNKNYSEYSCYEVFLAYMPESITVFEVDLPRSELESLWAGV